MLLQLGAACADEATAAARIAAAAGRCFTPAILRRRTLRLHKKIAKQCAYQTRRAQDPYPPLQRVTYVHVFPVIFECQTLDGLSGWLLISLPNPRGRYRCTSADKSSRGAPSAPPSSRSRSARSLRTR